MRKVLIALGKEEWIKKLVDEILQDVAQTVFLDDPEVDFKGVEVLVVLKWKGILKDEVLAKLTDLRFIQTLTAGVNHIPFEKIPERVMVAANSGANASYVAEHAFALLLAAAKRLFLHDKLLKEGVFRRDIFSKPLEGAVLGLLGLGSVGRCVLRLGKAFGMRVYAVRKSEKHEEGADFVGPPDALPFLLQESDYLVIALPLTRHTEGLIGSEELSMMKKNAVLINISRGRIVKQEALYRHLVENPEFTACLDVWWKYPSLDEPFRQDFPFEKLPNVIMTPHIAPLVPGCFENMLKNALENVRIYLGGDRPSNVVVRDDYLFPDIDITRSHSLD